MLGLIANRNTIFTMYCCHNRWIYVQTIAARFDCRLYRPKGKKKKTIYDHQRFYIINLQFGRTFTLRLVIRMFCILQLCQTWGFQHEGDYYSMWVHVCVCVGVIYDHRTFVLVYVSDNWFFLSDILVNVGACDARHTSCLAQTITFLLLLIFYYYILIIMFLLVCYPNWQMW